MTVYIRKFSSRSYFIGYAAPLQPALGLPEWAFPFKSLQSAFDCLPALLHSDMEAVDENCRSRDADEGRTQNPVFEWSIELPQPPGL